MNDPARSNAALPHARRVAAALATAAKRMRMSARSRRVYFPDTLPLRRSERVLRAVRIACTVLLFAIPSVAATLYYGALASSQYIAEARFIVRGGDVPKLDNVGALIGIPSISVAQDTQIVADYIRSRAIVDALQDRLDLRRLYALPDVDYVSRLEPGAPVERLVSYWESMVDVSIQLPAGIVVVSTRAFTPADATRIAETVVELSEQLVNELNDRMRQDIMATAQRELARAATRLARTRRDIERVRNAEGILDVDQAGRSIAELLTGLRNDRLRLRQDYDSQLRYVAPTAPQMRAMEARLHAIDEQILALEARLTRPNQRSTPDAVLSRSSTRFAELDLDRRLAERHYALAVAALETSRVSAERKLVYVATFLRPALPEEARYPKRLLWIGIIVGASLAVSLVVSAAATIIHDRVI